MTGLCFWFPYKSGQKRVGQIASITLGLLIIWTLIGNLDFLVIFIWPSILAFQIIFLTYWAFRLFGHPKIGTFSVIVLTTSILLIAFQPWISDWTFNEKDAQKMLSWHNIILQDDFEVIENESGGFRDYAHSFTLKISESDFQKIADEIRSSNNFMGLITDLTQLPMADYKSADTINYETENQLKREFYIKQKMEDGTYHFIFSLRKDQKELNYFGINE